MSDCPLTSDCPLMPNHPLTSDRPLKPDYSLTSNCPLMCNHLLASDGCKLGYPTMQLSLITPRTLPRDTSKEPVQGARTLSKDFVKWNTTIFFLSLEKLGPFSPKT